MRGTLRKGRHQRLQFGIIPAYAGNTKRHGKTTLRPWDHPRVCGEHWLCGLLHAVWAGSSPRMRGTHECPFLCRVLAGIIPAYAGNTERAQRFGTWPQDHPRVCGEHGKSRRRRVGWPGSSPRMRGTPIASHTTVAWTGIIPAYAGNTTYWKLHELYVRDHPRVCGEHLLENGSQCYRQGSSPRMRGTPCGNDTSHPPAGIIPAYAGNTWTGESPDSPPGDHPRVCGEHMFPPPTIGCQAGSSPRMRGTQITPHAAEHALGIIPAYAGNTT